MSMANTLIIGEPGCTAEGNWADLLDLLYIAKEAGCDAWKPQWVSDPNAMLDRRGIGRDHPKRAYYQRAYSWLAWPLEWHADFYGQAKKLGLRYIVTCFLPQDVAKVAPYADAFKIASFEAADTAMMDAVAAVKGEPWVYVSCGMCDEADRQYLWRQWMSRHVRPQFLRCVSSYPAPLDAMDLGRLKDYTGLSDHSRDVITGAVAVACGASIIEAHYRSTSCHASNPDYAVAFTPKELTEYVQNIRKAEQMMQPSSGVHTSEQWAIPYRVVS
jgi:pseudaminic acid synthase